MPSAADPTPREERPSVRVATGADAPVEIADRWAALFERSAPGHPYVSPAWAVPWWEHVGRGPAWGPGRARPHLVLAERGTELVGLVPLASVPVGPAPVGIRLLIGMGQENADHGGGLVVPGDEAARRVLAEHLVDQVGDGRTLVALTRLDADGDLLAEVRRAAEGRARLWSLESMRYPEIDLSGADAAGWLQRTARRNDVPRRERRLAELGAVTWEPHVADVDAGLDDFFELHDRRWEGRAGATGPFVAPRGRAFLREASRALDDAGILRLSVLRVDGRPVAARYGAVVGNTYAGMKSAWDPGLARYGLGHLAIARVVADQMEAGVARVDLLRGEGPHKQAWATGARPVGYWVLARPDRAEVLRRGLRLALGVRYRWREASPRSARRASTSASRSVATKIRSS